MLLGLASGLSWGVADFFGGLQSRKVPALAVALWSQVAGGITLLAVLGIVGGLPPLPGVLWGRAQASSAARRWPCSTGRSPPG